MRQLPEDGKFLVAFSLAGEQRELVRSIALAVEEVLGPSTVFLDEWYEYYLAGEDADLTLQKIYRQGCVLAIVCVSGNYGDKSWTQTEHQAIRARYHEARNSKDECAKQAVLPIRVGEGNVEGILINAIVPDARQKTVKDITELIIMRLKLIQNVQHLPESSDRDFSRDWPITPPSLHWKMADHQEVRSAFSTLLQREAPWRYLSLQGPSGVGKTHVSEQMLSNALRFKELPNLACGRFDFKGTTDIDNELSYFIRELRISQPPANGRLNQRFNAILQELKQSAQPTLLIFDTYEQASGEAQDWIEKQLLPSIVRNHWLRIVILGQQVPERYGTIWESDASPIIKLSLPHAADWYEYGKQFHKELELNDVTKIFNLAQGKDTITILSQLLGPKTS